MKYKFQLSGENYKLAKFELETLLNKKFKLKGNSVILDLDLTNQQVKDICSKSAMLQKCYDKDIKIWNSKSDKRFVAREPKKKIKSHPAMLKPKLARLLVNLTDAKKQILDPFCGTGSILIEAGVLGLKPIGSDIERKMVWFSQLNLKHFGIKAELKQLDATKLETEFKSIEAIACDPPYGRSSTLAGKKLADLYPKFLESAYKVLKKGGRLVMIRPHFLKLRIPTNRRFADPRIKDSSVSKKWRKLGEFDWYVHGGLTRKILVLKKC